VNESEQPNENGYLLSTILILLLVLLLVLAILNGATDEKANSMGIVLLGFYIQAWGLMFLMAYYFSHKSFFLRGLIWVCENFSCPRGKAMAFFYFTLAFTLGSLAVYNGLSN
jgi:hypothetical protein